jgi:hypothetical protein
MGAVYRVCRPAASAEPWAHIARNSLTYRNHYAISGMKRPQLRGFSHTSACVRILFATPKLTCSKVMHVPACGTNEASAPVVAIRSCSGIEDREKDK